MANKQVLHKRSIVASKGADTYTDPSVYGLPYGTQPKLCTAESLKEGEIAINYRDGVETLHFKNNEGQIFKLQDEVLVIDDGNKAKYLGADGKLAHATTADIIIDKAGGGARLNVVAAADGTLQEYPTKEYVDNGYSSVMERLNDVAQVYSLYGEARVNGEASPAFTTHFGNKENLYTIANVLHLGLVDGSGKLYKRCANGRIDKAADGTDLSIDGSDGDVMSYIDSPVYVCRFTDTINGNELNVMALGLAPFAIEGHPAKALKPFAMTPQYTVNVQLTPGNTEKGNGADKRACAHSIYNKNVAGTYTAQTSAFKGAAFKPDGNGFPHQYVNAMQSIWNGQCKNEVETTNRPFMGCYYEFYELWLMLMYLENGGLYHQALDNFGCGSTMSSTVDAATFCDGQMSGNSGVKTVTGSGAESYMGLMSYQAMQGTYPLGCIVGSSWYGFTEMLEVQRLLSDITKAGLANKVWKNKAGDDGNMSVIFEYGAEGGITVSSKTVDDINGGNIEAGKKYYQVRNTKACEGLSDGVMTAVVNTFIKFEFIDGAVCGGVDHTGGHAIYKFSRAIYRGKSLSFEGMFTQMQGCHYVRVNATKEWNPATGMFDGAAVPEGENRIYSLFKCAENVDACPPIASSSVSYFGGENEETDMEKGLEKVMLNNTANSSGWCKRSDYGYSLFNISDYSAGISSGECSYLWNYTSWANGDAGTLYDNGTPRKGRKCVNAVAVGCYAVSGGASARSVIGADAVSDSGDGFAGGFSLPYMAF